MVDDPVRFDLLSVNRLTVDKAVDTHTVVDKRRLTAMRLTTRVSSNAVLGKSIERR